MAISIASKQLTPTNAIIIAIAAILTGGGAIGVAAPSKDEVRELVREEVATAKKDMADIVSSQVRVEVKEALNQAIKEQFPTQLAGVNGRIDLVEKQAGSIDKRLEKVESKLDDHFEKLTVLISKRR